MAGRSPEPLAQFPEERACATILEWLVESYGAFPKTRRRRHAEFPIAKVQPHKNGAALTLQDTADIGFITKHTRFVRYQPANNEAFRNCAPKVLPHAARNLAVSFWR